MRLHPCLPCRTLGARKDCKICGGKCYEIERSSTDRNDVPEWMRIDRDAADRATPPPESR